MKRYIDKLASTHLSRELLTERKTPSPLRSKSTFPESDEIFGHEIDIDGMADSKQRTLDLLDPRTKDFNRDLEFQIIARDRQIDEMNNTILMLRTLIRIKEEELKSSKVNKIANIDKANSFIDQEEKLKEELRHEKDKWEIIKNKLEETNEENVVKLRSADLQVVAKENQLIEMKNDIKELSEIIAKMTDVYKELEVKYVKLTEDHNETQKKLYEANIKAVYADKIESEFEGIIRNLNKSKKQNVDFSKRINVIQSTVIDLRNDLLEYDEYSNNINQNLSSEDNSWLMWTKLKKFATESNKIAQKIRFLLNNAETIEIDETYNPDLDKLEALETELKTKTLQLEHSVSKELGQQDLIAHLRAFNKKLKSDFTEATLKIKLQFEILKNECERSKSSKKLLQEETTKINTENQEYKIKIEFYAARIEKLNETCKILQNKIDELQKTPRIVKVKSPVDNNTLKLQILKEEIFKKDTELVRKTKEIIKLEQDLIDLKESVQLIRLKAQIAEGDWFEKYKTILEDKDKELEILKGMLRGSYSELKLRESKVSLLRKRNLPNPNLNREHSRGNTTLI